MRSKGARILPAGRLLHRVHLRVHAPLWFGPAPGHPPRHRFDAPDGSFRTCYLALSPRGAFVETFLRHPLPPTRSLERRILSERALSACVISTLTVTRDLRLAALEGEGLQWHGVTTSDVVPHTYASARELALRIHGTTTPEGGWDGISWRSRHDDDEAVVALFHRARTALAPPNPKGTPVECRDLALRLEEVYPIVVARGE